MKSLILYYSYRGNTQRIAERIHSAIGGDIARIDTVVPYTGSYDDVVAQGEQEVKRGFLPELKAMDIDLDRYDTIVLGTPVWWYTCAPATRAFLTAHDLSGKTVYPFATNGGWLGRTLKTTTADNWADYDTVYIGYPIWWGIAAWPVDTFVKANDFTGKTVIPFCTSASSGIGESGAQLAALAGTGDWQEGQRFPSAVTQQEVTDWVKSLGK